MVGRRVGRDDRVLGFTRGLSLFIVPFLLVAFVILYLFPGETTRLWAWTIPVTMTSMTLASAYLGGAYFFLRVQREPRWTAMKLGFPAVALFSGLLGVATILHWDKFNHGHVSFWLWAGLYFIAPLLVVLGAVLCLAAAGLGAWFDPRWAAFRLMTEVATVMVTLLLLAAVRARDELDASAGLAWPLLVGMVALLLGTVALWVRYEWRPRQARRRATTVV